MPDDERAWKDVAASVSDLRKRLRERFEHDGDETDRQEVGDALRRFNEAAERLSERVGATAKDPEIREGLQRLARTLRDALNTTLTGVGNELRDAVERRRSGGTSADAGAGGTPADAAPPEPPSSPPEPPRAVPPTAGTPGPRDEGPDPRPQL